MTLLELQQLQVQQAGRYLLKDIDLQLKTGEVLALVGPNGAGKSTLLQRLAGVQPVHSGKLLIQQQDTQSWAAQEFARQVSFLPQLSQVSFSLTVQEVVRLGGLVHQWPHKLWQQKVQESIVAWDLQGLARRDVRYLSGGEQQRVQLARTWLQLQGEQCNLWILDEPFSALDLRHQALALKQIQKLKEQEKSIVVVVHDLNLARHCADRVLLLEQGKKVALGAAKEVLTAERVSKVFALEAQLHNDYLCWW